jgi:hypothetical protein
MEKKMSAKKFLQKLFRKKNTKSSVDTSEKEYQQAKKERAVVDKVQRDNGQAKEYRDISAI